VGSDCASCASAGNGAPASAAKTTIAAFRIASFPVEQPDNRTPRDWFRPPVPNEIGVCWN
jgi:hypothetical protein